MFAINFAPTHRPDPTFGTPRNSLTFEQPAILRAPGATGRDASGLSSRAQNLMTADSLGGLWSSGLNLSAGSNPYIQRTTSEGIDLSWYGDTVMNSQDGVATSYGQNADHYASQATTNLISNAVNSGLGGGNTARVFDVSQSYGGPYRPSNPQNVLVVRGPGEENESYNGVGTSYNIGLIARSIETRGLEGAYQGLAAEMAREGVQLSREQFMAQFGGSKKA
jgi:hypothetical protein